MTAPPARVVVVDDHGTFVRAVRLLFESDPDIDVVATAADGTDAVDVVMANQPDVVLMDISMPSLDGIGATQLIADAAPHVAIVILTMFDDDHRVGAAVRAGARGYLLKGASREEIRAAILAARSGQAIFGTAAARHLRAIVGEHTSQPREPFPGLTDRERDVLDRLAAGLDNAGIARSLHLSDKTVRNYVSLILAKLGLASRSEAIVVARDAGLGR